MAAHKPYFIGMQGREEEPARPCPNSNGREDHNAPIQKTTLNETHKKLGARMVPFAGWEMPVWYSSVIEEHKATRQAAGLFDVSHMGVCDASGPNACAFLDTITANDVSALEVGNSHYNYLLGVDGVPIDDMMIYRIEEERYLIVINAVEQRQRLGVDERRQRGQSRHRLRSDRGRATPRRACCAICAI